MTVPDLRLRRRARTRSTPPLTRRRLSRSRLQLLARRRPNLSAGLCKFADLTEHQVGPSQIIQTHYNLPAKASQEPGVTCTHLFREQRKRGLRLLHRNCGQWKPFMRFDLTFRDCLRSGPNPDGIRMLDLRSTRQRERSLVLWRMPSQHRGLAERLRLSTILTGFISGLGHALDGTRITLKSVTSRLLMPTLPPIGLNRDSRRALNLHERRTHGTDR